MSWPGMCELGAGQVSLLLYDTKMRMFPPPWNDCSWTVSALCPCRDRACLLQPSPREESFLWLPALYFRKVPIKGARPLPLWLQPQCPWFLVRHWAPWDSQVLLALVSLLPCSQQSRTLPHYGSIFFVTPFGPTLLSTRKNCNSCKDFLVHHHP